MQINDFISLSTNEQVDYLLSLDDTERGMYLEKVKKKNKMLNLTLSGKVQSEINLKKKRVSTSVQKGYIKIAVKDIRDNPHQPRKRITKDEITERKDSIRSRGLLQPIRVYVQNGIFYLIAGQIRLEAFRELSKEDDKYKKIQCVVEESPSYDEFDAQIDALTENLSRNNMFILDTATSIVSAFKKAKQKKGNDYSIRDFSKEYSIVSASNLAKYLKILDLDDIVLAHVKEKNFNRFVPLYEIATLDISNDEKIKLIDDLIAGRLKAKQIKETEGERKTKNTDNYISSDFFKNNFKSIKKHVELLGNCESKDDAREYTSKLKKIIEEIEKSF